MANLLQQHFPIIQSREAILGEIHSSSYLSGIFQQWNFPAQEEFLDLCSGVRGVKVLYDGFAKQILNPETHPERLNELLSLIFGKQTTILQVLPNDNTRIADESSLLLMDIVIRLEDGSIANVEVQKVGYHFPGQRCACYSSDLLLRQYKSLHAQPKQKLFSYRDMKNVYTIVFFEQSTREFHEFPDVWKHHFEQTSDTGLKLDLLQEYYFIPLDIFRKSTHNKPINNRFDAWLTFLSSDDPEDIVSVISRYPDFKAMYEHIYEICLNVERVMEMFSKELLEMDRNTVHYMIDEMQEEINHKAGIIEQQDKLIEEQDTKIEQQDLKIEQQENELSAARKRIAELEALLR